MKYLFALGNNPALSLAELSAVFGGEKITLINNDLALLDMEKIDPGKTIKNLGGTIKIASLEKKLSDHSQIKTEALKLIKQKASAREGKIKYGLSPYGKGFKNINKLGLEIKKDLKRENINSRLVTSKEKNLSSVVVETNKLAGSGIEIILSKHQNKILLGKTLAVQPFKELSFRDYGRPARDSRSGMLPPKLAQILINLAGLRDKKNSVLLDPFCGSGTILTEAALTGYKNLIGSDSSTKAIRDTEENLNWTEKKFNLSKVNFQLFPVRAEEIAGKLKNASVDSIVTEPYLGPQRGKIDFPETVLELEKLYSQSLNELGKILKPGGKIVMVWPIFQKGGLTLRPELKNFKIKSALPENLKKNPSLNLTQRNTIIYKRPDQKVWREIVILQKGGENAKKE